MEDEMKMLKTPRGTFRIAREFSSDSEAREEGFGYYFSEGDLDIYTYHIDEYHCKFATVKKERI